MVKTNEKKIVLDTTKSVIFKQIMLDLKESLEGTPINVKSLHLIIKTTMEIIEDTPITGTEQKEIALKILRQLFIDFTDDDIESTLINLLDTGVIGNLIDLITDASKGKLNINKIVETSTSCIKFLVPLFCKKKSEVKTGRLSIKTK
jgi:hypothetical protein